MGLPATRQASYQDVLNAPPHLIAEIIDGELQLQPRPSASHADAATGIVSVLAPLRRRGGDAPGGWQILFEPELHLAEDIVVPDVAGWRRERLPHVPKAAFLTLAPDWVCEVLSPATARIDRSKKMRLYARTGVEYLWMVDPLVQVLEVFRLGGEFWQQVAVGTGSERVRMPPFEEVEVDLVDWWGEE